MASDKTTSRDEAGTICLFNTHRQDVPDLNATTSARLLSRGLNCNQPNFGQRQNTDLCLKETDMMCEFNTHNVPEEVTTAITEIQGRGSPCNQPNSGRRQKTKTKQPQGCQGPAEPLGGLETSARGKDNQICFKKESPLWIEVEGLEEFRKFPQNPTFGTLESSRMDLREGQAIGLMVTFSNMVKKISTMSVDADKKDISNYLEVLQELEDNGFDVHRLRVHVRKILALKNRQEAENNIRRMNEIIKERREATEEASSMLAKLKTASTLYKTTVSYLETLEAQEKEKADRIRSVRMEFEALVASPLY